MAYYRKKQIKRPLSTASSTRKLVLVAKRVNCYRQKNIYIDTLCTMHAKKTVLYNFVNVVEYKYVILFGKIKTNWLYRLFCFNDTRLFINHFVPCKE